MGFLKFWRFKQRGQEINEEVNSHLQMAIQDRLERGEPLDQARHAVRREFGNIGLVKETVWNVHVSALSESIGRDIRYALRILFKNPGFSAISVLALALGIGGNSAIYNVVRSVLLSPLPFPDSKQLVRLWDSFGTPGNYSPVSYPNFQDWRAWNHSFSDMAAYAGASYALTEQGEPIHIEGIAASANLFSVLGTQPLFGRTFLSEEDRPGTNNGVNSIILSHRLWKSHFAADRHILGRVLLLDGKPFSVIGVMPSEFNSYTGNDQTDFWVTAAVFAQPIPGSSKPLSEEREMSFLNVIARLKPGLSVQQAQSDMDHAAGMLMQAYPKADFREGVMIRNFHESIAGDIRPILLLLFGAAGTVFAITCANLAGLLSARMLRRYREMNIRSAIGAGKWRIVRQLLTENLLLCSFALLFGWWFAMVVNRFVWLLFELPPQNEPGLNWPVFGFASAITVFAAAVLSIAPAVHVFKSDLIHGLKEAVLSAGESRRQRRFQHVLTIVQVSLAMVLLSTSILFTGGLIRLQKINLGFQPEHTLAFPVDLAEPKYNQQQRASVFRELETCLSMLPGVLAAGAGAQLPLQYNISKTTLDNVGGRPISREKLTGIAYAALSGDYFRALGTQVLSGRGFTAHDNSASEPVVVINQAAAHQYFGSENPVGQQIEPVLWNGSGDSTRPRTIVGVVADIKLTGIADAALPTVYWPFEQIPSSSALYVIVRTAGNPSMLVPAIRAQMLALDKSLPLYNVQSPTELVRGSLKQPLHLTAVVATFGMLALVLTAIGVFGIITYNVAQQTREIGIRMALGAQRREVLSGFLRQAALLATSGLVLGLGGSIAMGRFLQSSFFGVPVSEPGATAIAAFVLLCVVLTASFFPALRATRIDPLKALRYE